MSFKIRKIRQKPKKKWLKIPKKKVFKYGIIVVLCLVAIIFSTILVKNVFFNNGLSRIFSSTPFKIDEKGNINFLLLGVGGSGTEGGNLSDSIMIMSISPENQSISMLNLPRDLFISSAVGDRKINEIYASARFKYGDDKGLKIVKKAVSDFLKIEMHYAVLVDFKIFADFIDLIGGLEIYVPNDIVDPFYPDENYGYQTFIVRQGLQKMDGETTLKYARSRKTTSDYSRASRQQEIILAIKRTIEKQNIFSIEKITELYNLLIRRINTDMSLSEIISLAKIGIGMKDSTNIVLSVLNDNSAQRGGLLYTPAKEFYGGQFVLLPENSSEIRNFLHLILENPAILNENAQIKVLNGSKIEGNARKMFNQLRKLGLHVVDVDNYETDIPLAKSFLKVLLNGENSQKKPKTVEFLKKYLNIDMVIEEDLANTDPNNLINIELILGTDNI